MSLFTGNTYSLQQNQTIQIRKKKKKERIICNLPIQRQWLVTLLQTEMDAWIKKYFCRRNMLPACGRLCRERLQLIKCSEVERRVLGKRGRYQGHSLQWKTNTGHPQTLHFTPGLKEQAKVKLLHLWGNHVEKRFFVFLGFFNVACLNTL